MKVKVNKCVDEDCEEIWKVLSISQEKCCFIHLFVLKSVIIYTFLDISVLWRL
jgi:hypothetical protein